jgi:2-polyprenyl-3-methyl-5-hydroxy-6-metoxy-1,4-benzoquinol methylase
MGRESSPFIQPAGFYKLARAPSPRRPRMTAFPRVGPHGPRAGAAPRRSPGPLDGLRRLWQGLPMTEDLEQLIARWWYYTVELAPGRFTKGQYPDKTPMLPRIALRGAGLRDADCLDLGTMEGLIPILMKRGGARRVLALDAGPHCAQKLEILKQIYSVDFQLAQVGLMYELSRRMAKETGFDVINVSGLLYHVFSPLHIMAGVRPLLKRNGLMIVSTNVILRDDFTMEYNAGGRLQGEGNTFWYHSVPALEHMIRLFNLEPIDCMFYRHADTITKIANKDVESGYMSVVCRAIAPEAAAAFDPWIGRVHHSSWEYQGLCDAARAEAQAQSGVEYHRDGVEPGPGGLHLLTAARSERHLFTLTDRVEDTHTLRLADLS